ncbi:glycerophosphoryl diester phosphodiesterase membrane domain-containing protein [Fructilactobacillus carniphilus]|uniref:Glycerophosphoryl diester phosphodiesterase membrane domain-containing protein n=1 Tax=Fructilactobacillus carniphilus TaxID=2940297 RepID=A0ABY5BY25_9LACO|nr:glycerophosphoryl diester phosphodiesterase membrane domain-containing protein [Fructilactobacillus carniphilus]USS90273.1 hypothetical protein M3M37_05370 [Fructilactobacillus carniphilus]
MIREVLRKTNTTIKNNFWSLWAMFLPITVLFCIYYVINLSYYYISKNITDINDLYKVLFFVIYNITFVLEMSFSFGIINSLKKGKFQFKNTFVAFRGFNWLPSFTISVISLIPIVSILVIWAFMVFMMIMNLLYFGNSSFFVWLLIGSVLIIFFLIYVWLRLQLLLFTYFVSKDADPNFFHAIKESFRLVKGHRWQLIAFNLIQLVALFIIAIVCMLVINMGINISIIKREYGNISISFLVVFIVYFFYAFYALWMAVTNVQIFLSLLDLKTQNSKGTTVKSNE